MKHRDWPHESRSQNLQREGYPEPSRSARPAYDWRLSKVDPERLERFQLIDVLDESEHAKVMSAIADAQASHPAYAIERTAESRAHLRYDLGRGQPDSPRYRAQLCWFSRYAIPQASGDIFTVATDVETVELPGLLWIVQLYDSGNQQLYTDAEYHHLKGDLLQWYSGMDPITIDTKEERLLQLHRQLRTALPRLVGHDVYPPVKERGWELGLRSKNN